jgi:predicted nucleotidyltransferase
MNASSGLSASVRCRLRAASNQSLHQENTMEFQDKKDILQVLQKHRDIIQSYGVQKYGLFGSFSRNEQKPDSDVDILVEFAPEKKNFDNFMNLAFFLEDILGRKVDLVTRESLSPYIGPRILEEVEYVSLNS